MKKFINQDFLLTSDTSKRLYHEYAEQMPIIDYHCHLSPKEIYEDRSFDNITQLWLGTDHYKWRLMRANGIDEYYITGGASDYEKFHKWAQTLEVAIGNPLYHWSHLELQRYFGYEGWLTTETSKEVWGVCNEKLHQKDMSTRNLICKSKVELICTTDDPVDSLKWHMLLKEDDTFAAKVLPTWRPDKVLNIEQPGYQAYMDELGKASDFEIRDYQSLLKALHIRMDYFSSLGCLISDHGLSHVPYIAAMEGKVEEIFAKRMRGEFVSEEEASQFKTTLLAWFGREYHRRGWVMQLHYGVKRDNNTRIYQMLGADAGADCIHDYPHASRLTDFLNALDRQESLPKTIIYPLNPIDNTMLGTIVGCFQSAGCRGKIQQGSAWWFNDHKDGMLTQMKSLASQGILGNFVGMLTDSRSFLSYTRHEYFRRILCDLLGKWVEMGEYPNDEQQLEKLVKDISYYNALYYFGFKLKNANSDGR